MWSPDPTWERLAAVGDGSRVWRREVPDRGPWVGKRLVSPLARHPAGAELDEADLAPLDPGHVLWWRREADVVQARWAEGLPGLRGPGGGLVEEDDDGVTLWWPWVERPPADEVAVAHALGTLTAARIPTDAWVCDDLVGDRWRGVEATGGWTTLAETPASEVARAVWGRRTEWRGRLAALPRVVTHGDVTPGNLLGRAGAAHSLSPGAATVVACDWSAAGTGPVGLDLGFFALHTRSRLLPLADAYVTAAEAAGVRVQPDDVLLGARVHMAFTVLTRLDRVLERVRGGEGGWSAKLRHPAVAPSVRALQRAYADIEPMLT
ncbi:phosphotransferase [Nocardioidaceae bacterium]|nr:phosphotransferase [Nocardioidaceae bacterium]